MPARMCERCRASQAKRGSELCHACAAGVGEVPARCACGNGEAEEDRGAVLRCPVHGQGEVPAGDLPPLTERPGYNASPNDWVRYANWLESRGEVPAGLTDRYEIAKRALHRINGGGSNRWMRQTAADAINEIAELDRAALRGQEETGR